MIVVFLGTGGSVPTSARSLPAVLVQREGEQLMFDCGEGVQRQMIGAGISLHKKMKLFITHMHGDHVLGLPGLLQTMALLDRDRELEVYGPRGIACFLECIKETVQFVLTFPVRIHEISDAGIVCQETEYVVQAVWANHVIPSLAYALMEKPRPGKFHPEMAKALGVPEGPLWSRLQRGQNVRLSSGKTITPEEVVSTPRSGRKIVYTGDTRPFQKLVELAVGADLLIHDSTLGDDLAEKAEEDGHSTPSQAAEVARNAKVKRLILTHISARYGDSRILLNQAKRIFKRTQVAKDLMKMEVPFPEP